MADSVNEIEKAVLSKDLPEITKVYKRILPGAQQLLPHFKNERLREVFEQSIHHVEDLLQQLEASDATYDHVEGFLRKIVAQSTILLQEVFVEAAEEAAAN